MGKKKWTPTRLLYLLIFSLLFAEGKWVRLQFEPQDEIDRYGRLLAYVFLEDGT